MKIEIEITDGEEIIDGAIMKFIAGSKANKHPSDTCPTSAAQRANPQPSQG
jgi:hypothetical protein